VIRFDGATNGEVSLEACWSLRDADGKELAIRRSAYSESTAAQNELQSCEAQVEASSALSGILLNSTVVPASGSGWIPSV
jgi:uncharacterized lipoprotein YmbA